MRLVFVISVGAALAFAGCASGGGCRGVEDTDFAVSLREADSVYNHMEFDKAYDLYHGMLDLPEVGRDNAKLLEVLYSLANVSEMASRKNDQMMWITQLIDQAKTAGNGYYLSQGLMLMGKHIYYEGDRVRGVGYVRDAVDAMSRTDRRDTDHMTHSQLNVLSSILDDMGDIDAAVATDRRNVRLTYEGTRWGTYPQIQLHDQRTALAKLAAHQMQAGHPESADSAYRKWKAVPIDGVNLRDYFIVDYLRECGMYPEAEHIYDGLISRLRTRSDTLSSMMRSVKLGLAEVSQKMGKYRQSSDAYADVLEISDTLQARQARANAQELAAVYETKEKEHQLQIHRRWIALLCSGALMLAIILVSMLLRIRAIQQKNRFMAQALDELSARQTLFRDLSKKPEAEPSRKEKAEDERFASLFAALDTRLDSEQLYLNPDLNRNDLCRLIGVDKNVLGHILKQYSGVSNSQIYINRKRIHYAVLLLHRHPEWTMLAIAESCGMRNTATFNRIFRQTYGMTPTEYMKSR